MTDALAAFRLDAPPRRLTAEVREELDLPVAQLKPYRWSFACLVVATACLPLVLASLWKLAAAAVIIGLVIVPAVRWFEHREASWREDVYRSGLEATGRVIDIEPAGPQRKDHVIRVEFFANGTIVNASVIGCPLARKGLMPSDYVVILYAANRPTRCLVIGRSAPPEILDAIFED
jgi:hypothetical protein